MRQALLIGCGLIVVLAGITLYVLARSPESAREDAVGAITPTAGLAAGAGQDHEIPSILRVESEAGGEPISTAPFTPSESLSDPEGWRVRVIESGTGAAVSDIEVAQLGLGGGIMTAPLQESRGYVEWMEGWMRRADTVLRTDEKGEVVFPVRMQDGALMARNARYFGLARVNSRDLGQVTVEVSPVGGGTIKTLGVDGLPRSDVPVAVVADVEHRKMIVWRGSTRGPEGLAHATNVPLQHFYFGASKKPCVLYATFDMPLESRPTVVLEKNQFPAEPIRLQLPETGCVSVTVSAPNGRDMVVRLYAGRPMLHWGLMALATPGVLTAPTENGRVVFEVVGLNLALQVEAHDPEGRLVPVSRSISGPRFSGETIEVGLTVEKRRQAIRGRVVDAEGRPVTDQALVMLMPVLGGTESVDSRRVGIQTDAGGRFEFHCDDEAISFVRSQDIVEALIRSSTTAEPTLEGIATLRGPLPPGNVDLGEIVLRRAPIAISGIVIDDRGEPISKVRIVAGQPETSRPRLAPPATWSDGRGRFSIRWPETTGDLELTYDKKGYWAPETPSQRSVRDSLVAQRILSIGTRDVVLTLSRTAALVGSLRLDPDTSTEEVRVVVGTPRGVEPKKSWSKRAEIAEDASFSLEGLVTSEAEVRIVDVMRSEVVRTIPRIRLESGATCCDPRLQQIDLRGVINNDYLQYVIKVTDAEGNPLGGVWFNFHGPVAGGRRGADNRHETDSEGCLTLVSVGPALRAQVGKQGFVYTMEELRPGTNEITLQRPYVVRLTVKSESAISSKGLELAATLALKDEKKRPHRAHRHSEMLWTGEFTVSGPGRYTLELRLQWIRERTEVPNPKPEWNRFKTSYDHVDVCPPKALDVEAGTHLTEIEIRIPPDVLKEALRRSGGSESPRDG